MADRADDKETFPLKLPLELRLQIYRYAVPSGNLTISTGPDVLKRETQRWFRDKSVPSTRKSARIDAILADTGHDIRQNTQPFPPLVEATSAVTRAVDKIVDREAPRNPKTKAKASSQIPGVPHDHFPIVQEGYHEDIIECHMRGLPNSTAVLKPICVRTSSGTRSPHFAYPCSSLSMLHLTCRQIHEELSSLPQSAYLVDLHLSYPGGVCALMHCFPHLLNYARKVRVAGNFDLETAKDTGEHGPGPCIWEGKSAGSNPGQAMETSDVAHAIRALQRMTSFLLGEEATLAMAKSTSKAAKEQPEQEAAAIDDSHQQRTERTNSGPMSRELRHSPLARPLPFSVLTSRIFYRHCQEAVHLPPPRPVAPTSRMQYKSVFSCRMSPITNHIGAIVSGDLKLTVARGSGGTGVELLAKANGGRAIRREYLWPSFDEDLSDDGTEWVLPAGGSRGWDALEVAFERPENQAGIESTSTTN